MWFRYILLFILIFFSALQVIANSSNNIVAITQIVSHPALDKVREGLTDTLKNAGVTNIVFENAHSNINLANQIAKKFIAQKAAVIVTISTPSAIAAKKAVTNDDIPIVFATVTDPIAARLVDNLDEPGSNITGIINYAPIEESVQEILKIFPNIKNIGVIYNPSEANSVALISRLNNIVREQKINLVSKAVTNTVEISQSLKTIINKIDALLLIQDNTAMSSLPTIVKISKEHKIPTIATFTEAVEKGVLIEVGVDEYEIGVQTANIVLRVLQGEQPGKIAISIPRKITKSINEELLQIFNIRD